MGELAKLAVRSRRSGATCCVQERTGPLTPSTLPPINQPVLDGQRGWIENFQRVLKIRLEQLLGEDPFTNNVLMEPRKQ